MINVNDPLREGKSQEKRVEIMRIIFLNLYLLEMPGDYVSPLPLLGCCNKDTP